MSNVLPAPAVAAPVTAAAAAGLAALEAVLAIHGTVATGLEWHRGLLSASGADHAGSPRCAALKSAASRLLVFLRLTACFTALGLGVAALAEEVLILNGKRE